MPEKLKEKSLVDIKLEEAHNFQKDNLNANKCMHIWCVWLHRFTTNSFFIKHKFVNIVGIFGNETIGEKLKIFS